MEEEDKVEEVQRPAKRQKMPANQNKPPRKQRKPPDGYPPFDLTTKAGKKECNDWVSGREKQFKNIQAELLRRAGIDSIVLIVRKGVIVPHSPDSSPESRFVPSLTLRHILDYLTPDFQAARLAEETALASSASASSFPTPSPIVQLISTTPPPFASTTQMSPSSSQVVINNSTMTKEMGQLFVQVLRAGWNSSLDDMFIDGGGTLQEIFPKGTASGKDNKLREGERNKVFPAKSNWSQEQCINLLNRLLNRDALSENFKQRSQKILSSMQKEIAQLAKTACLTAELAAEFTKPYSCFINVFAEKWGPKTVGD